MIFAFGRVRWCVLVRDNELACRRSQGSYFTAVVRVGKIFSGDNSMH